jgi:hypothetical protein
VRVSGPFHIQHTNEYQLATKVKFTTPFGVARYPHISSPDTKGKFADDKYKTKLVFPIGDPAAQAFKTKIEEAAFEIHGKAGLKLYMPFVEDEDAGEIVFITKTNYAPAIFDSKGKQAPNLKIGSGSVLRLMGNIVGFEKGISAQFNQVQIKELNGFGECGFDAVEDGYEYDASDAVADDAADGDAGSGNEGAANGSALDI